MRASSRPSGAIDRADARGPGDHDVSVVFDGAQPGEGELLRAHRLVERGVVGGHGEELGPVEHRFPGRAVEDDLPARRHPDRDAGGVDDAVAVAGNEVPRAVGEGRQQPEEAAPRQVLAERLHDLLVVALARAGSLPSQTMTVLVATGSSGL